MKPNAYILDYDPKVCATMHPDKALESQAKIIGVVLRAVQAEKHPLKRYVLTKWAVAPENFWYLKKLGLSLLEEQKYRFGNYNEALLDALHLIGERKTEKKAVRFLQLVPAPIPGDPVKAYRHYCMQQYQGAAWTKRETPQWWVEAAQLTLTL